MHIGSINLVAVSRRAHVVLVAVSALIFALGVSGLVQEAWAATVSQCTDEFSDSSAGDTCKIGTITVSGDDCTINASCKKWGTAYFSTSITVNLDDVDDLLNCEGTLALSCE